MSYVFVAVLGALVGGTELVTRYHDSPAKSLRVSASWLYIGVNAVASIVALFAIHTLGWTFGAKTPSVRGFYQAIVAGFGSLALLRTSLFNVRIGEHDIAVGPSAILLALLQACERIVNQRQAIQRSKDAVRIMQGVSFAKAQVALPAHLLAAMNVSPADQANLRNSIKDIADLSLDDDEKATTLGIQLIDAFGTGLLEVGVAALGDKIKVP